MDSKFIKFEFWWVRIRNLLHPLLLDLNITYASSDETVVKVVNSNYLELVGAGTAVVVHRNPVMPNGRLRQWIKM